MPGVINCPLPCCCSNSLGRSGTSEENVVVRTPTHRTNPKNGVGHVFHGVNPLSVKELCSNHVCLTEKNFQKVVVHEKKHIFSHNQKGCGNSPKF